MSLFRLAYLSHSTLSADAAAQRLALGDILLSSRSNNASARVTGALLATSTHFAQLLEGPRDAVEETYRRIVEDPRHEDLCLLLAGPLEERQFPHWSMAFIDAVQTPEQAVARLTSEVPNSKAGRHACDLIAMCTAMLQDAAGARPLALKTAPHSSMV